MDLPARRVAGPPQGRADHPRGARRDRLRGDADAGAAARRAVAQDRPLRHRRDLQAEGPARRRPGARDDPRGDPHVAHRARGALLPRPPEAPLPHPDEGAGRAAPARRPPADTRVHHEGRVLVRPRPGGPRGLLPAPHRGLRPHLRPHRARVVPGRERRGDDGRLRRPRVHGPLRSGGERRGPVRLGLRRQRRDRERRAAAGRGPPVAGAGAEGGRDARRHDDRGGLRAARRAAGRADQGVPDRHGGPRAGAGGDPRRPPPERGQAPERPGRRRSGPRRARRCASCSAPSRASSARSARRSRCSRTRPCAGWPGSWRAATSRTFT